MSGVPAANAQTVGSVAELAAVEDGTLVEVTGLVLRPVFVADKSSRQVRRMACDATARFKVRDDSYDYLIDTGDEMTELDQIVTGQTITVTGIVSRDSEHLDDGKVVLTGVELVDVEGDWHVVVGTVFGREDGFFELETSKRRYFCHTSLDTAELQDGMTYAFEGLREAEDALRFVLAVAGPDDPFDGLTADQVTWMEELSANGWPDGLEKLRAMVLALDSKPE